MMDNSLNENVENEKENESFLKENKIIFKKYHPIKAIGKGTFSTVYASINIITKALVAIKAEKRGKDNIQLLQSEAFLLYSLRGFGIPEVLSYGRIKTHNILVLPLLGKSLLDMFILGNSNTNINDICSVAIQILDRIEWVHSNNIVYRDIKPENFLFGKKDNDVLYLIDFGLCRKYKSSRTGKHIKPKCLGKFTGTSRYASVYAMAGNEQSRRDDIESIGYMIIFFMKKRLPWQGIKGRTYKECYHKLFLMKKYMKIEELCKNLPREIIDYMNIAKAMKFEQEPDYKHLKDLFKSILKKNNVIFDKYIYSWCRKEISNSKDYNAKNNDKKIERKTSPQNRLYKKIQENIEKKIKYIPSTNIRQISANDKSKNITINSYDNSMKNKMGINSELSNTMKVMINKNINSINSGSIEPTGINLPRINSDKNIYKDNFISFRGNSHIKKHYSPDNKKNIFLSLKEDNNNKNSNSLLRRENMQKDGNVNRKIISFSPISNSKYIKVNYNNIINYEGTNNKKNNLIKISKIIPNNANNLKNNNIINNNNIIYNTFNTFNTYNSFNNTIDKSINNNINKIYQRKPEEINNYQNYERIKQKSIIINKDEVKINKISNVNVNNVNINNANNKNRNKMIKIVSPLVENNAKSLNNKMNGKLNKIPIKISSIDVTLNSNKSFNDIKKGQRFINNKLNDQKKNLQDYSKIPLMGYADKVNKNNRNNSNSKNNRKININSLNENNLSNMRNNSNYYNNYKRNNVIKDRKNLIGLKFFNNINNSTNKNKSLNNFNSIQNIDKNDLNEILKLKGNINKNSNNSKNKQNTLNAESKKILKTYSTKSGSNSLEKVRNINYSTTNNLQKAIRNNASHYVNCSINTIYHSNNSLSKNHKKDFKLSNKKIEKIYVNKNKKVKNSIRINKNHIFYNNSFNNINSLQNNNNNERYHKGNNNLNIINDKTILIKMEPKMLSNHSTKIDNKSSTLNKTNDTIKSYNNIIKDNNCCIDKFKTEEISIENKVNRINKYKIIRNKVSQYN